MTVILKQAATRVLGPIARRITAARSRVLMYHRFGEAGERGRRLATDEFVQHLEFIRTNFRPARLADLVSRITNGEPLEPRTVVVTVDDGYADFADHAVPLLAHYEIPATIYLVSRFVGQEMWLWFDAAHWLTRMASAGDYEIKAGGLSLNASLRSETDRDSLWLLVADRCLALGPEEQDGAIAQLQIDLNLALPPRPTTEYAAMTWQQVERLDPGLIEIGAHTRSHVILSRCSSARQTQEIDGCKRDIERMTRRPVHAFCYPNGMPLDYDDWSVDQVRNLGFTSAVLAAGGFSDKTSDPFRLERFGAPHDIQLFKNAIDGLWHLRDRE